MSGTKKLCSFLLAIVSAVFCCLQAIAAAPPVRIAVVTGGGSGIEQEIVDKITNEIQNDPNVAVSTVNPDWYVVCNIKEMMDQMSGQIRYNGNVIIKTTKGKILDTVAVQKYNQDFSLTPGTPLNKALVDRAAREATQAAANRTIPAIQRAVQVEMETREQIIKAQIMAEQEEYDGAINALRLVTPDSPHFENARDLMAEFSMEKDALENLKKGQSLGAAHKYGPAIAALNAVPAKSKYKGKAKALAASYGGSAKRATAPKKVLVKNNSGSAAAGSGNQDAELKALDKVLKMEKKAIEDAQSQVNKRLNK
ncbi:hypothetical protein KF728_26565 [Candidatus Obscuribacterales bacterium]|nr:hypothetical protein [Candidatus Obscuribacterales bacterium]